MDLVNVPIYFTFIAPGLAGALVSPLFVTKSTWATRGVGFAVGEGAALTLVFLFLCGISGPSGKSLGSCALQLPMGLASLALSLVPSIA